MRKEGRKNWRKHFRLKKKELPLWRKKLRRPKNRKDLLSLELLQRIKNLNRWSTTSKRRDKKWNMNCRRSKSLKPKSEIRSVKPRRIWSLLRMRPRKQLL